MDSYIVTTALAYCVGAGVLSFAIGKFSPTIGSRFRHALAGIGPLAGVLGAQIAGNDSVTLVTGDLLFGASLAVGGVASSIAVSRIFKPSAPKRLRG